MFYSGTESQRVITGLIRITGQSTITVKELHKFSFMVILAKGQASVGVGSSVMHAFCCHFLLFHHLHTSHILHITHIFLSASLSFLSFLSYSRYVLLPLNRNRSGQKDLDVESLFLQGLCAFFAAVWMTLLYLFFKEDLFSDPNRFFQSFRGTPSFYFASTAGTVFIYITSLLLVHIIS